MVQDRWVEALSPLLFETGEVRKESLRAGVGEPVWVEACAEEKRNERRVCE